MVKFYIQNCYTFVKRNYSKNIQMFVIFFQDFYLKY